MCASGFVRRNKDPAKVTDTKMALDERSLGANKVGTRKITVSKVINAALTHHTAWLYRIRAKRPLEIFSDPSEAKMLQIP